MSQLIDKRQLGMKWYKLLIYFGLFFLSLLNILDSIGYLVGNVHVTPSHIDIIGKTVYEHYGPILRITDIVFGILLVGLGVFGIVLRQRLAKFKPDAPTLAWIFHALSPCLNFIYSVALLHIMSTPLEVSDFVALAIGFTICILDFRYFEKRKHLFEGNKKEEIQENA